MHINHNCAEISVNGIGLHWCIYYCRWFILQFTWKDEENYNTALKQIQMLAPSINVTFFSRFRTNKMCFQATSPHNVRRCKSSIKISQTQRWPLWITSDRWAHSHPKTANTDTLVKWCPGFTRLTWNPPSCVTLPRCPSSSCRGVSQLLRAASLFGGLGGLQWGGWKLSEAN